MSTATLSAAAPVAANPELGRSLPVRLGAHNLAVNLHDLAPADAAAAQPPVLLIHGSGPGVSAFANWRLLLPVLAQQRRVLAPDMLGFGYTQRLDATHEGLRYDMDTWVAQAVAVLDALDLPRVDLVGNSFGGALSLALAIRHPQRVRRLVLMGSVGVPFPITPGLDAVWGYQPSLARMRELLDIFAHSRALVTDELAQLRYEASIRPGFQESFAALFPAPRQRWVDAMCSAESDIRALPHQTLVVHGREDRVIPLANSLTLAQWIARAQLHVYPECGHWTQIEHAARFARLVSDFLAEAGANEPLPLRLPLPAAQTA